MDTRRRGDRAPVAAALAWSRGGRGWLAVLAVLLADARAGIRYCYLVRSQMRHFAGTSRPHGSGASSSCRPGRAPCRGSIECRGVLDCQDTQRDGLVCCAAAGLPCLSAADCCGGCDCSGGSCCE